MRAQVRIWVLVLLALSPAISRAEREGVAHSFHSMSQPTEIEFTNSNKTATTELTTYTCTGGAEFGVVSGTIYAILSKSGGTVTTTQIKELSEFRIDHPREDSKFENLKVYLAKNGGAFGSALSGDSINYQKGHIVVTIPRGNYAVKLTNTDGTNPVRVSGITYYMDHCNCFEYIPE